MCEYLHEIILWLFQGSAPTVSIDNTAGCQFYLSKDALSASITTAKSSEVNILVPGAEPDGDWVCLFLLLLNLYMLFFYDTIYV